MARLTPVVRRVERVKSLHGQPEFEPAASELIDWANAENAPIPDEW